MEGIVVERFDREEMCDFFNESLKLREKIKTLRGDNKAIAALLPDVVDLLEQASLQLQVYYLVTIRLEAYLCGEISADEIPGYGTAILKSVEYTPNEIAVGYDTNPALSARFADAKEFTIKLLDAYTSIINNAAMTRGVTPEFLLTMLTTEMLEAGVLGELDNKIGTPTSEN